MMPPGADEHALPGQKVEEAVPPDLDMVFCECRPEHRHQCPRAEPPVLPFLADELEDEFSLQFAVILMPAMLIECLP
jgi:hypothetical protein